MSAVKRVAPRPDPWGLTCNRIHEWHHQCLQDLAAKRHALECECDRWLPRELDEKDEAHEVKYNACTEIVRCALEMRDYECEVGDAKD